MALPQKIQVNAITGASLPSTIDNDINTGIKQPVIDILGIPDNTNISNAVMEVVADGLKNVRFRDAAANPATAGYLQRNAALLNFYDGTANRVIVSRDLAETLTNKTLTTPIIASISNTGTLTLPTTTDTLVGRATTDTLTNKTLSSPVIASPTFSGTMTGVHTYTLSTLTGTAAGTYTLGGTITIPDTLAISGSSDTSKKLAFEVDGVTTATTRTQYIVDEDANSGQSWEVKNLTLVATVAASALTVAVKTKAGTDPSATNPIVFKFRHVTEGNGTYTLATLTAALSLVVSSGSTLGTLNGIAHRLYLGVALDGATLRLFIYNPHTASSTARTLTGLNESNLYSSTAEGGVGGADSPGILYSETAFTAVAIRVIGYIESTQATAGTWATTPSKIHILKLGDKRTGDVVQHIQTTIGTVGTGTTDVFGDNTIPQITEGDEFMTQAITPTSVINLLEIEAKSNNFTNGAAGSDIVVALFQDAIANALKAETYSRASSDNIIASVMTHLMPAGTVSLITFRFRAGTNGTNTYTFNGSGGVGVMGGVLDSHMKVTEIFV